MAAPLGTRLRELRQARGLTTRQLAARAGVSQGTVSHLEMGRRLRPGYATVVALAEALGLSVAQFVDGTGVAEFPEKS